MNPVRTNVLHLEKLNLFISSTTFAKGQAIDLKFLSLLPDQSNYFYRNVVFKGSFTCSYPGLTSKVDILKAGYLGPLSSQEGLKMPQNLSNLIISRKGVLNMTLTADKDDTIYYCVRAREDKKVMDDIYRLTTNESKIISNHRFFFVFGKNYIVDGNSKTQNGVFLSETKEVLVKAIEPCRIVAFYSQNKS